MDVALHTRINEFFFSFSSSSPPSYFMYLHFAYIFLSTYFHALLTYLQNVMRWKVYFNDEREREGWEEKCEIYGAKKGTHKD